MIHEHLQPLIQYLHTHPHWGGLVAFLAAFVESLAVIGTIVPGSVTMTAIGVLIGTGILPAGPTILWAIAGAYAGDCLSYWAGIYYKEKLPNMWPFRRYPKLLPKGEAFFKLHGGKSIIIGRFTGPVRSLVPMIAGLLRMRPMRFLPICLVAALLWALVYTVPGILIGALSMELPPSIATKFILLCLVFLAALWGVTWLIKFFFDQMWTQIDNSLIKLWNYLNIHKNSHWITRLLRNPKHKEDHQQLVRAVFAIFFALLFLWIVIDVMTQGFLVTLNLPLFNLLQSAHTNIINYCAIALTILSDPDVLLIATGIILLWLCWQRNWWAALHWLMLTILTLLAIDYFRLLIMSPRPPLHLTDYSPSFPADHTLLSLTLLGFIAILLGDNVAKHRRAPIYISTISLILAIAFATIYLGSQWLTDVLGSIFLGMFLILMITLSYRRHNKAKFPPYSLGAIFVTSLVLLSISYGYFNFQTLKQSSTKSWPIQAIGNQRNWWNQSIPIASSYRKNRFGYPSEPLNLQWHAPLDEIKQALLAKGWQYQPSKIDLTNTINHLGLTKKTADMPIIPLLYHNQVPKLVLIKVQGEYQAVVMVRLWQSDVVIGQDRKPLWIGTITYYQPGKKLISLKHDNTKEFLDAIDALTPDLKNQFRFKIVKFSSAEQPAEMKNLNWDGRVLLIRDQSEKN